MWRPYEIIEPLVKILKPSVYVELGIYKFETMLKILPFVNRAIGIDIKNLIVPNKKIEFYSTTTDKFYEQNKDKLVIDFLFIDANHSYEQTLQDFINYSKIVKENGIIVLHDTYPENEKHLSLSKCGTAYKAVDYIRKNYGKDYEIMTIPVFPGMSLVRKSKNQLHWKI